MTSDKQRIKDVLVRNEGTWVCSKVFFTELFIKDYAQRVSDLRSAGLNIEGQKCDNPVHDHKLFMYKYTKQIQQSSLL